MLTDALTQVAGIFAALVAVTLVVGTTALAPRRRRLRPWLLVLFQINARRGGASHRTLRQVVPVDIFLLAGATTTYAGFWPALATSHGWVMRVGMGLSIAQPVVGIPLLLVTRTAGRSGLMGGALLVSILLLTDGTWTGAGWLGVAASTLLLVGDFASTPRRTGQTLAMLIAIGYAALLCWFVWLAIVLLAMY